MCDVWIPATGSGILNINEGTLGILGYVVTSHFFVLEQILMLTLARSLISSLLGAKAQWITVNGKN
jgi:peroxin-11B